MLRLMLLLLTGALVFAQAPAPKEVPRVLEERAAAVPGAPLKVSPEAPKVPEFLIAKEGEGDSAKLQIERYHALAQALAIVDNRVKGNMNRGDELLQRADIVQLMLEIRWDRETEQANKRQCLSLMVENAKVYEKYAFDRQNQNIDHPINFSIAKARRLRLEIRLAEFEKSLKK
jgi:hypothetical protein